MTSLNPEIFINEHQIPTCWEDLSFQDYADYIESKLPALNYFTGFSLDELQESLSQEAIDKLIINSLNFLEFLPAKSIKTPKFELINKTIEQKLIALSVIRKFDKHNELSFPYLIGIFSIDKYAELEADKIAKEYLDKPFAETFWLGLEIFNEILTIEKNLDERLTQYRIPVTNEEKQAGIESLMDLNSLTVIDQLAGGNPLAHETARNLSIKFSHAYLYFRQKISHYNWKVNKIREAEMKRNIKKRRK